MALSIFFFLIFGNCNFCNKFLIGDFVATNSVIITRENALDSRSALIQFYLLRVMITDLIGLHSVLLLSLILVSAETAVILTKIYV